MTTKAATTKKERMVSPLKKWRSTHCHGCDDRCVPGSGRFQACLLSNLLSTIRRDIDLEKVRALNNEQKES